jgi:hypothetical protein
MARGGIHCASHSPNDRGGALHHLESCAADFWMTMAFNDTLSPDCKLCRGLRPPRWRAEWYEEYIGQKIDLRFESVDLKKLPTHAEICPFCAFVKAILDHYCHEWGRPRPECLDIGAKPVDGLELPESLLEKDENVDQPGDEDANDCEDEERGDLGDEG